jgi:demethylmenaquinone methyltransferase / 2-methoxy-6-polyprenyl-1,4-benzoquinol methylase
MMAILQWCNREEWRKFLSLVDSLAHRSPSPCHCARSALLNRVPDAVYVKDAFARIADRYVFANHVMSGGMDIWWRKRVAWKIRSWKARKMLDVASGTGDLALEILAHASARGLPRTMVADALNLPFSDASYDVVTVAFGLRNMADYPAALREMARVLEPGGRLVVLDFSIPGGILHRPYRWYLHNVLPKIAGSITQQKDAYEYLGASIEQFPQGEAMCQLMLENGFSSAEVEPLTFGVVSLYVATK